VIYENGTLLAESRRFADVAQLALADIDLDRLLADRMRQNTFGARARRHARETFRTIEFALPIPTGKLLLERKIEPRPLRAGRPLARAMRAARRCTASRCRAW
jgi:NAD+ synthase (glutamine-hydrolysing)